MWHIPVALKTLALCLLCTGWTLVATSDLKGDPDLDSSYGQQNVVKHLRFPNDIDNNDLGSDPFEELDKYVETLVKHLDVSNQIKCLDIENYFPHSLSELVCNCTDKRIFDQLVTYHQHKLKNCQNSFFYSQVHHIVFTHRWIDRKETLKRCQKATFPNTITTLTIHLPCTLITDRKGKGRTI